MTVKKMTVQKWYGSSVSVPTYQSSRFVYFAASCMGIVRSLLERTLQRDVRVKFMDMGEDGTAAADPAKNMIYINQQYLNGTWDDKQPNLSSDEALTFILGIIVHEVAHFAYSPPDRLPWINHIKDNTTCAFNQQLAGTLGNIVEDIFIEAEVERRVPIVCWTLDFLNGLLFSDNNLFDRLRECEDIHDAPHEMDGVVNLTNLLIYAKTRDTVSSTPYVEELFALAKRARNLSSLQDRLKLTLDLYERIMRNWSSAQTFSVPKFIKGVEDIFRGSVNPFQGSYMTNPSGSEPGGQVNQVLERLKNSRIEISEEYKSEEAYGQSNLTVEDTPSAAWELVSSTYRIDSRYLPLAEHARQLATTNRPYGMAMVRGNHMRNLSRIATDGRIFAEPVQTKVYKPMEAMVVVDCSSSMNDQRTQDQTYFQAALAAAGGVGVGLVEGRCDVALYGHSFGVKQLDEINIYCFKAFHENIELGIRRLDIANNCVYGFKGMSRDGVAFEYLAKKFGSPSKRRVMLVISDGEPNSPGYQKERGIHKTSQSVRRIRAMGIDVYSLSISKAAIEPNNLIYGKEYNTYNDDPGVLQDIAMRLLNQ